MRPGQRWRHTYDRLRRAYRLLAKLAQREELFAFLNPAVAGLGIASTTNQIEGAINAQLRDLLRRHRGIRIAHQRRAIAWWLFARASAPTPLASLLRPEHHAPPPRPRSVEDPIGTARYDTGPSLEDGLWHRRGWAGRS